jgi:hypothetical protein
MEFLPARRRLEARNKELVAMDQPTETVVTSVSESTT